MNKNNIKDIFFDLDHTLWDFDKNSNLTFIKIFDLNELDINTGGKSLGITSFNGGFIYSSPIESDIEKQVWNVTENEKRVLVPLQWFSRQLVDHLPLPRDATYYSRFCGQFAHRPCTAGSMLGTAPPRTTGSSGSQVATSGGCAGSAATRSQRLG